MGSSSTSWISESNTHAGSSKAYDSTSWSLYTTTSGLRISGAEGQTAQLELWADEGDDAADKWLIDVADGGSMTWQNYTSGSYATKLTLSTAGALTVAGATQLNSTLTVGVNDTGYDVKFFGATASSYMLWDESINQLKIVGSTSTCLDIITSSAAYGLSVTSLADEVAKFSSSDGTCMISIADENTNASSASGLIITTDTLCLRTLATDRLCATATGIGIGTNAPSYNLDVRGTGIKNSGVVSTDNNALLYLTAGTNGATDDKIAYIYMGKIGGSGHGVIKYSNSATGTSKKMEFQVNGTAPLTLEGNGRAGIGITAPTTTLQVVGSFTTGLVTLTATDAITAIEHSGRILIMADSGGDTDCVFTLPAATGTGNVYKFVVGVVNTSTNGYKIQVVGDDTIDGKVFIANDVANHASNNSVIVWKTAATSDTITLDGDTTGGASIGDYVELIDIAADQWSVSGMLEQSGTEATPFSAAVS